MFVEECRYVVKEKKMPDYITDHIETFPDSGRKILIKKFLINKILLKKLLMRKIKYSIVNYNSGFKRFIKYLYNSYNS